MIAVVYAVKKTAVVTRVAKSEVKYPTLTPSFQNFRLQLLNMWNLLLKSMEVKFGIEKWKKWREVKSEKMEVKSKKCKWKVKKMELNLAVNTLRAGLRYIRTSISA